jgi:hypothetical protein
MAAITTQRPTVAGVAMSAAAASVGGDTFTNTGREFFHAINASVAPITVTFKSGLASANVCNFGVANAAHDLVVVVPAGADRMWGPFDKDRFNNPATGLVSVTYSDVTTLTVRVL